MSKFHFTTHSPLFLLICIFCVLSWLVACQPAPRNLRPLELEPSSSDLPPQASVTPSQTAEAPRQTQIIVTATPSATPPATEATEPPPVVECPDDPFPERSSWCYTSPVGDVFVHPIAFVASETTGYLLDSGRVFELPLDAAKPPRVLLAPSQIISNTKVLEPLDITLTGNSLLALDRAGDVYRYSLEQEEWGLDRYDRPIRDLSSHYFLSLTSDQNRQYMLETSYSFGLVYGNTVNERLWRVPEGYLVDLAVHQDSYFTLYQPYTTTLSAISLFQDGIFNNLPIEIEIERPRQLETNGDSLYLLDQAGHRLSIMNMQGVQQEEWSFDHPISSFALYQNNILLATTNSIHWLANTDSPTDIAIPSAAYITTVQPNDPEVFTNLPPFICAQGGLGARS